MYADLVGSTKMSMTLPVERMAKIIKAFSHELSSVVKSYNGFVLKYVGDAIFFFLSFMICLTFLYSDVYGFSPKLKTEFLSKEIQNYIYYGPDDSSNKTLNIYNKLVI